MLRSHCFWTTSYPHPAHTVPHTPTIQASVRTVLPFLYPHFVHIGPHRFRGGLRSPSGRAGQVRLPGPPGDVRQHGSQRPGHGTNPISPTRAWGRNPREVLATRTRRPPDTSVSSRLTAPSAWRRRRHNAVRSARRRTLNRGVRAGGGNGRVGSPQVRRGDRRCPHAASRGSRTGSGRGRWAPRSPRHRRVSLSQQSRSLVSSRLP